jgi:hypothetical protein
MQPFANQSIDLFQEIEVNLDNSADGGILASTTTDVNGYFKFEFKDKKGGFESIRYAAGAGFNHIIDNIPQRKSIDGLILYKIPTTNIQVSLNVIKPYTTNDTLVINDIRTFQNIKIPGPFSSGILYTATDFPLLAMYYSGEQKSLYWYFNQYNGTEFHTDFIIDKYCSDTIKVVADIN